MGNFLHKFRVVIVLEEFVVLREGSVDCVNLVHNVVVVVFLSLHVLEVLLLLDLATHFIIECLLIEGNFLQVEVVVLFQSEELVTLSFALHIPTLFLY